jgi:hypothetical protein
MNSISIILNFYYTGIYYIEVLLQYKVRQIWKLFTAVLKRDDFTS